MKQDNLTGRLRLGAAPLWRGLLCGALLAILSACGGGGSTPTADTPSAVPLTTLQFQPTQALLNNPERGLYSFGSDLSMIDASYLADAASQGYRLIYIPHDLSAWRDADLPESYLTNLRTGFAKVRAAGVKLVLRFAYNYPANETEYLNAQDASLARVQGHIAQLAPILADNSDVIAIWQAGFIGAWGEWHTSSNGLTSAANKLAVRDTLLAALPANRSLQVRYPGDLSTWFAQAPTAADLELPILPARAKIGLHNDCFLASNDDVGTYFPSVQSASLRAHVQATSDVVAFGGETCFPPVPAEARMDCPSILAEGAAYRLTYLNRAYYQPFFDRWIADGCMDEINRKMGYRIEIKTLEYSASVARGGTVTAALTLANNGWARLMNDRPLVLRLETAAGVVMYTETVPARTLRLLGPGQTVRVLASARLPDGLAAGRYRITMAAPDAAATLAATPAYAMRFANADNGSEQYWDATRAVMVTGAWVTIN
jgi:Domain of unknown function (DUF4832)/Domain of unknown function (DUF4874)